MTPYSDIFNQRLPFISRTNSVEFDLSYLFNGSFSRLDSHPSSLTNSSQSSLAVSPPLLIILSGLPACGKSTVAKYLDRHLKDKSVSCKIYNAGNVRRALLARTKSPGDDSSSGMQPSSYFKGNSLVRDGFAFTALEHCLLDLLSNNIQVGIFDATNSTKSRRTKIHHSIQWYIENCSNNKFHQNLQTMVLDVKCTNLDFWKFNMELKVSSSPDYVNNKSLTHQQKLADFVQRTYNYILPYEPITTSELDEFGWDYLVLDNCGQYVHFRAAEGQASQHFHSNYYSNNSSFYSSKLERQKSNLSNNEDYFDDQLVINVPSKRNSHTNTSTNKQHPLYSNSSSNSLATTPSSSISSSPKSASSFINTAASSASLAALKASLASYYKTNQHSLSFKNNTSTAPTSAPTSAPLLNNNNNTNSNIGNNLENHTNNSNERNSSKVLDQVNKFVNDFYELHGAGYLAKLYQLTGTNNRKASVSSNATEVIPTATNATAAGTDNNSEESLEETLAMDISSGVFDLLFNDDKQIEKLNRFVV